MAGDNEEFEPETEVHREEAGRIHAKLESEPEHYDGRLARLRNHEVKDTIKLGVEPVLYSRFCATNLKVPLADGSGSVFDALKAEVLSGSAGLSSKNLANPLNVIFMVVSSDDYTFIPQRASHVYERPGTWQATVGGALKFEKAKPPEHPVAGARREAGEELGLDFADGEFRVLAVGVNQNTGEPDLIGIVRSRFEAHKIIEGFTALIRDQEEGPPEEQPEYRFFEMLPLREQNAASLLGILFSRQWSQPSDQTAYLLTLIEYLGKDALERELAKM